MSSTARRCRETTDAVHRAMRSSLDIRYVDQLYNATPEVYLDIIGSQTGGLRHACRSQPDSRADA